MHPAAKLQIEKMACEYSQWRSVPENERSPAPTWWWAPAMKVVSQREEMTELSCYRLELPIGSTYAAGAVVLMSLLGKRPSPGPLENPVTSPIASGSARRSQSNRDSYGI